MIKKSVTRSQFTIGVVAGWQVYAGTVDSFLEHVLSGIQAAAVDQGCNLLIACGNGPPRGDGLGRPAWPFLTTDADFVPVGPWNCDGLILIPPFANQLGQLYFEDLLERGYPIVFAGDRDRGPAVVVDNQSGIHQAIDHLAGHGHKNIAFIAGRPFNENDDSSLRLRGYQSGLRAYGLPFNPNLVAYGQHTLDGGRFAMRQILEREAQFSAVIASNDSSAIGAIEALQQARMNVPRDIAVIGFDDRLESRALTPPLTTVHFPMYEIGYQSVEFLLKRLSGSAKPDHLLQIPVRLIIRESCGCPSGAFTGLQQPPDAKPVLNKKWDFSEADLLHDDQMKLALTAIVQGEAHRFTRNEIGKFTDILVNSFWLSLNSGIPDIFHTHLLQVLEVISSRHDDLYAWQMALSLLRMSAKKRFEHEPSKDLSQVDEILHQARVAINEASRAQHTRSRLDEAQIRDMIGLMTDKFFRARSQEQICDIFQAALVSICLKYPMIILFEPDGNNKFAWSRVKTSHQSLGRDIKLETYEFPPPDLFPGNQPWQIQLLPLYISDQLSGFAAFDVDLSKPYAEIIRQLGGALYNVELYQEAISARQLAEDHRQLAEEANYLKSRFLSMISHELRTPLNLIAGLSDMLLKENRDGGEINANGNREDLERIFFSAQHLDGLIRDVLDLARSDVGQLKLTLEPLDLAEVLGTVAVIGEHMARDKGLIWNQEIAKNLPKILGDRTRLRQVVLNLVNNAVKFTSQGEINLAAYQENDWVVCSIRDTGLGIPIEDQDVIFNEFRQSERTSERGFGGLGLGLAICKRLVEMHGGQISVCSPGLEDQGSTFSFMIPVMRRVDNFDLIPLDEIETVHRVVCLARDGQTNSLLAKHLSRYGYELIGYQVDQDSRWLNRIMADIPSAVVLEQNLASEQGWEILRRIKENTLTQNIPVLFLSLVDGKSSLLELDYLIKPVGANGIAQTLISKGYLATDDEKTILVIDDDPGILDLHSHILKTSFSRCRVIQAHNGREGLTLISKEQPDLVLLDLMMPRMDGYALLDEMKSSELGRHIPVIVITSQALTEEDMARLNRSVTSILGKGIFTPQETLEHITSAITHHQKEGYENQRIIRKAMAYIHQHYQEAITRHDVAGYVGLSERHLDRCFIQALGISPMTYLNRFRIQRAKQLLEVGDKPITEVAMETGFSSSGYFTRVFRNEVGISPRAYLKSRCK